MRTQWLYLIFGLIPMKNYVKFVKLLGKKAVALDTEFIRIRTFYPQLGLIQLFDGQTVSLIDPQKIQDFSAFCHLLADEQVTKVLHACSEDLEVFQHRFQQLPTPMIDTQIMAGFLGLGASIGFAKWHIILRLS